MKPEVIRDMLSLGENQHVEFKSSPKNMQGIGKNICAFLNSGGGYIVIGIDDRGNPVGVNESGDIDTFEKKIIERLAPKALVSFEEQLLENKRVWVIEVPAGADIPYSYEHGIYIREGERTLQADVETIRDMIMRRQMEPERWERRFSDADLSKDLDGDEIRTTIRRDRHDKFLFAGKDDPVEMLEYLGMVKYGRLSCGGDVLFCKNPAVRHPQTRLKAVRYRGSKTDDTYVDMQVFEGPVIKVLEQAFAFIQRNTSQTANFKSHSLQREERSVYPSEAIREGLVNAFAHRDYADFRGGISVQIYSDRLEIWNSGAFPEGITTESVAHGHLSILRNPDIAHVLYTRGLMEKLGRGGVLIRKACEEYGMKQPVWQSNMLGVTLTFFATTEVTMEVTTEVTTEVTMEVLALLRIIDGEYKKQELRQKMGLKNDEHFRKHYIVPALESKLVEMTIPDKPKSSNQRYRLSKKGKQYLEHEKGNL